MRRFGFLVRLPDKNNPATLKIQLRILVLLLSASTRASALKMNLFDKLLATRLGFAGLIPFVTLSLACWIVHPGWLPQFIQAQLFYGIAILSFLGGLHWGVALLLRDRPAGQVKRALLWGVMPSIFAWVSMVNVGVAFLVQMIGFVIAYQVDKRFYADYGLPEWFLALRFRLTCIVIGSQALTFLAANLRNTV